MPDRKHFKRNDDCLEERNADIKKIWKSIEKFSTDLHQSIAASVKGNFVCSPLNIHLALSMCAFGAQHQGYTFKEMFDVLHLDEDTIPNHFKMLISDIKNVTDIEMNVSGGIFAEKNIVFKDDYIDIVNQSFSSNIIAVNFAEQLDKAFQEINNWCDKQSENRIKKKFSIEQVGKVDPHIRLILANGAYFKADWLWNFGTDNTVDKPFFLNDDIVINVPTMHISGQFMYSALVEFKAECVGIPYANSDFWLLIIRPKPIMGLKDIEKHLDKLELQWIDKLGRKSDFTSIHIDVELPRFNIESSFNCNDYLKALGMLKMFSEQADYKRMSERPLLIPPIHIDAVLHKASIRVTEDGTEPAVTTHVHKNTVHGAIDFRVNRPFLFRVVNRMSNLTIFSGRCARPNIVFK